MNPYIQPSGSSSAVNAVTTRSSSTTIRERHTKAILVALVVILGLLLGMYVGRGEV